MKNTDPQNERMLFSIPEVESALQDHLLDTLKALNSEIRKARVRVNQLLFIRRYLQSNEGWDHFTQKPIDKMEESKRAGSGNSKDQGTDPQGGSSQMSQAIN